MENFNVYLILFSLAIQGIMHLLFTGRLTGKKQKARHFAEYLSMLCLIELISPRFFLFNSELSAIGAELFLLYAINHFAFGNRKSVSWTAAVLAIYISQFSFGIINSVESVIFPKFIGTSLLYLFILLATLAAFILCALCYLFVLNSLSLSGEWPTPYIGLLLFPSLFFFAAELYILQTAYSSLPNPPSSDAERHLVLFFLQSLGLGALLCTQYAYQKICLTFKTQAELASLTQAVQAQKTYIAQAQMRYDQTKAFRHDIKNHLSIVCGLLNSQKTEEAKIYLQKLEKTSDSLSFPCQTGNPVMDILLSEKLGLAHAQGISTETSLLLPRPCHLDDFDLCVIFSNALDNAIEACRKENGKEQPFIHIFGKQQGNFYFLEFKNTCTAKTLPPMGTGLSNIQSVALKYHGAILTNQAENSFCLNVLLNIDCTSLPPDGCSCQKPCNIPQEQ